MLRGFLSYDVGVINMDSQLSPRLQFLNATSAGMRACEAGAAALAGLCLWIHDAPADASSTVAARANEFVGHAVRAANRSSSPVAFALRTLRQEPDPLGPSLGLLPLIHWMLQKPGAFEAREVHRCSTVTRTRPESLAVFKQVVLTGGRGAVVLTDLTTGISTSVMPFNYHLTCFALDRAQDCVVTFGSARDGTHHFGLLSLMQSNSKSRMASVKPFADAAAINVLTFVVHPSNGHLIGIPADEPARLVELSRDGVVLLRDLSLPCALLPGVSMSAWKPFRSTRGTLYILSGHQFMSVDLDRLQVECDSLAPCDEEGIPAVSLTTDTVRNAVYFLTAGSVGQFTVGKEPVHHPVFRWWALPSMTEASSPYPPPKGWNSIACSGGQDGQPALLTIASEHNFVFQV
jgi:hypothetical protein